MIKERPILFSAPMVQAILAGNKTQTRRVVKMPDSGKWEFKDLCWPKDGFARNLIGKFGALFCAEKSRWIAENKPFHGFSVCPYGQVGDQIWVRENGWERPHRTAQMMREGADTWKPYYYDADGLNEHDVEDFKDWNFKRRPSIHMPRWASRIQLEITNIRVERLFDLSEDDAMAEGCNGVLWVKDGLGSKTPPKGYGLLNSYPTAKHWFACLWDEINGSGSWSANPWVWVIEFKQVEHSV